MNTTDRAEHSTTSIIASSRYVLRQSKTGLGICHVAKLHCTILWTPIPIHACMAMRQSRAPSYPKGQQQLTPLRKCSGVTKVTSKSQNFLCSGAGAQFLSIEVRFGIPQVVNLRYFIVCLPSCEFCQCSTAARARNRPRSRSTVANRSAREEGARCCACARSRTSIGRRAAEELQEER